MELGKKKINSEETKEILKELIEGAKTTHEEQEEMKRVSKQAQENAQFIQKKKK